MRIHYLLLYHICLLSAVVNFIRGITLEYSLDEDQPEGTFVADIPIAAEITTTPGDDIVLEYSFLSSDDNSYFTLNSRTGILSTGRNTDRDQICASLPECVLKLDIVVTPAPYTQVINIWITLVDLNDHAPQFAEDVVTRQIIELSPLSSTITLPTATDADIGINDVQEYYLEESSDISIFRLEVQILPNSLISVQLVLMQELDAETTSEYDLILVARDGGDPAKTATTRVTVLVTDANDNAVLFDQDQYEVEVDENLVINSTILHVTATDADVGIFGQITYYLATTDQHVFDLNPSSGELYLIGELDYEQASVHHLVVEATDAAIGQPVVASVTVHVLDVNDNAPLITVSVFSEMDVAEVKENSPPGAVVAYAFITDRDSGANSQVTCNIDNSLFRLEALEGQDQFQIVTQVELDREGPLDVHQLTVTCSDSGDPILSSTEVINVSVTDDNDHAPVFGSLSYSTQIQENAEIGTSITQVCRQSQNTNIYTH